jgi:hypothetical protein
MSPIVLRIGPYRIGFYAADGTEPPHVHVESGNGRAKFWLMPVRLEWSTGYKDRELNRIERLIVDHQQSLIDDWNSYFAGANDEE